MIPATGLWRTPRRPGEAIAPWRLAAEALYRRAAVSASRRRPRERLVPARVVSVGGLEAGGVGKTPCVVWWMGTLAGRTKVAVVCRPYGAAAAGAETDEVSLLRSAAPPGVAVVAAARKSSAARRAVEGGAELVLVDDGFSHHALARDLDLVLLDARLPFANGHLLPAGPLREPPSSLARANAVALSRADRATPDELERATRQVRETGYAGPILRARHAVTGVRRGAARGPSEGVRAYCMSGLGRPGELAAAARAAGAVVVGAREFGDHALPARRAWEEGREEAARLGAEIWVSAKDEARLPAAWRDGIAVLEMRWEWLAGDEGPEWLVARALGNAAR